MERADQNDNFRLVHSKFDNLYFDGVDRCMVRASGQEHFVKFKNKIELAKQLNLDTTFNFPLDERSPVLDVNEKYVEGEQSIWQLKCRRYSEDPEGQEYLQDPIDIAMTPNSTKWSFCKCTEILVDAKKYKQHYMFRFRNNSFDRLYEYVIEWSPGDSEFEISLVS